MPERIQQKRVKGWRKPAGAVSVVRGTTWGNPFKVGETLHHPGRFGRDVVDTAVFITAPLAVALFEAWVSEHGYEEQIRGELAGRDLMCFCSLGNFCHADTLLRIANPPGGSLQDDWGIERCPTVGRHGRCVEPDTVHPLQGRGMRRRHRVWVRGTDGVDRLHEWTG